MKNPLRKRIWKELVQDAGKYIVIFIFMFATIGFVSGFLVADNSMKDAFDKGFEKYNIEDGVFEFEEKASEKSISDIESQGVKLYENFFTEQEVKEKSKVRIYANRDKVDLTCLLKGRMPSAKGEIALDRLYANYNNYKVGDMIKTGNQKLKIVGFVSLSDYSAMFENNSDMIFDITRFGVAVVTKEQFNSYSDIHYNYSWKNNDTSLSEKAKKDKAEDLMKYVAGHGTLANFIPEADNQSIHFAGTDMGGDKAMITTLLYILIFIMAFVFAVTIRNTIEKESGVIGTLRASGYTKGELVRHYLTLPVIVTILAAAIGNVLGYTVMKTVVSNMYYNSYCLPTFNTLWNMDAFITTTIVPALIMAVVNLVVLEAKLSLSPLKFLRHDLRRKQKKRVMRLPNIPFMHRFRLRVIFQNMPNYLTILIGVLFANVLLMFGLMMTPLVNQYSDEVANKMFAKYQYFLKAPFETQDLEAEKFSVTSLANNIEGYDNVDEFSIYGIQNHSRYVKNLKFTENKMDVYVSKGFTEKYNLEVGDTLSLKDKFDGTKYNFHIIGTVDYPAALVVFMKDDSFHSVFNWDRDKFSGYFANKETMDIPDEAIATTVTKTDLMMVVIQMKKSLGSIFPLVAVFAVLMSVLIIYLLSKIVIEKNANSISMVKILGYNNHEVSGLYIVSTSLIVLASILVAMPISNLVIQSIYKSMMSSYAGWMTLYMAPIVYIKMFIYGALSYVVVAFLQYRRIKKVPMDIVLKNAAE